MFLLCLESSRVHPAEGKCRNQLSQNVLCNVTNTECQRRFQFTSNSVQLEMSSVEPQTDIVLSIACVSTYHTLNGL